MAGDIEELKKSIESLRSEIKSMLASYNSNNVEVQQSLTAAQMWQASHEKMDEERWDGIREKLAELKGMLETIPIKVNEDIKSLWAQVEKHGEALTTLKGVWMAVSIGSPVLFALIEYYLHGKG